MNEYSITYRVAILDGTLGPTRRWTCKAPTSLDAYELFLRWYVATEALPAGTMQIDSVDKIHIFGRM